MADTHSPTGATMNEHPVLLDTPAGAISLLVTEPEGPALAAAVLLHGAAGSRAGVNRIWARLARSLASLGIVVVRLDYPGLGSSLGIEETGPRRHDATGDDRAVRAAVDWLKKRTKDLDLLVIGACYGGRVGARLAATERLAGLALIAPALHTLGAERRSLRFRIQEGARIRLHALRNGRLSASQTRTAERADSQVDHRVARSIAVGIDRTATWLLIGAEDAWLNLLPELQRQIGPSHSRLELEVIPGVVLQGYRTREAQDAIIERVVAWARRRPALQGTDRREGVKR